MSVDIICLVSSQFFNGENAYSGFTGNRALVLAYSAAYTEVLSDPGKTNAVSITPVVSSAHALTAEVNGFLGYRAHLLAYYAFASFGKGDTALFVYAGDTYDGNLFGFQRQFFDCLGGTDLTAGITGVFAVAQPGCQYRCP